MRIFIFKPATLILFLSLVFAQIARADDADKQPVKENVMACEHHEPWCERCCCFPEAMPEFPGGEQALLKFVYGNLQFPVIFRDDCIAGKVIVQFTVCEDGSLADFKIAKSSEPEFSKEVLRVVALLPRFKPGMQSGKPVPVCMVLPVRFVIN